MKIEIREYSSHSKIGKYYKATLSSTESVALFQATGSTPALAVSHLVEDAKAVYDAELLHDQTDYNRNILLFSFVTH